MENLLNQNFVIVPLWIKSDLKGTINLIDDISLEQMSSCNRKFLLKILESKESNIYISKSILNSNYYFYFKNFTEDSEYKNSEKAYLLTKATRLVHQGQSESLFCISKNPRNNYSLGKLPFIPNQETVDITRTIINLTDIDKFKNIILRILNTQNNKFNIMSDRYIYGTSNMNMPLENKFIDLMTILEMLYFVNGKSSRLKGRVHKILGEDEKLIEKLYNIRSGIVHSGQPQTKNGKDDKGKDLYKIIPNDEFEQEFNSLAEITRKSLLLYLDESIKEEKDNKFAEENLKLICNPEKIECYKKKNKLCKDCHCEVES